MELRSLGNSIRNLENVMDFVDRYLLILMVTCMKDSANTIWKEMDMEGKSIVMAIIMLVIGKMIKRMAGAKKYTPKQEK